MRDVGDRPGPRGCGVTCDLPRQISGQNVEGGGQRLSSTSRKKQDAAFSSETSICIRVSQARVKARSYRARHIRALRLPYIRRSAPGKKTERSVKDLMSEWPMIVESKEIEAARAHMQLANTRTWGGTRLSCHEAEAIVVLSLSLRNSGCWYSWKCSRPNNRSVLPGQPRPGRSGPRTFKEMFHKLRREFRSVR